MRLHPEDVPISFTDDVFPGAGEFFLQSCARAVVLQCQQAQGVMSPVRLLIPIEKNEVCTALKLRFSTLAAEFGASGQICAAGGTFASRQGGAALLAKPRRARIDTAALGAGVVAITATLVGARWISGITAMAAMF